MDRRKHRRDRHVGESGLPAAEAILSPCAMLAKPFDLTDLLRHAATCATEAARAHPQAV